MRPPPPSNAAARLRLRHRCTRDRIGLTLGTPAGGLAGGLQDREPEVAVGSTVLRRLIATGIGMCTSLASTNRIRRHSSRLASARKLPTSRWPSGCASRPGASVLLAELLRSLAEAPDAIGSVPEGVKDVIGRRPDRLPPPALETLTLAAVLGTDFRLATLRIVASELRTDDLIASLEAAVAARLVVEDPEEVDRFSFAHALVRETLYERRGLHSAPGRGCLRQHDEAEAARHGHPHHRNRRVRHPRRRAAARSGRRR